MRDFRDAKAMARALRDALKAKAIETTHTETLELIAKAFGYENWNILSAKIEEAEPSASAKAPGSDDGSLSVEALLTREVDHRAKNILSVVQAIAHQTEASSVQEFIARFDERIRSLKASHDLLVKSKWRNLSLAELVRAQLAHFGPMLDSRIIVRGPDLTITVAAAQAIGMAIHELATNAGKYGALSNDTGHVNIAWGLERADAGGERFRMDWSESGGPTVVPPTRRGFGSTAINTIPEYAPRGRGGDLLCSLGSNVAVDLPGGERIGARET
jgi:two-component sensor histidine kinase